MKRAFDANVSRSKPRTRIATAEVAERDPETGLSADLAAALVGPRAFKARNGDARRAGMIADVAGSAAATVSRGGAERPVRDALLHTEQGLAEQAGEAAHGAARENEGADRSGHRAKLAQAMRMAAARVAEAAAEVTARQPPEWVVRAAVPGEDLGLIGMGASGAEAPEARKREASMAGTNAGGRTPSRTAQETVTVAPAKAAMQPAPAATQRAPTQTQIPAAPAATRPAVAAAKPAEAPVASRAVTTEAPAAPAARVTAPAAAAPVPAAAPVANAATPAATVAPAIEAAARAAIEAGRPRLAAPGEETVAQGRARIAEIRGRLAATVRPRITAEEVAPETATAAVRRAVDELRARLGAALAERDQLARTLESTRDELAASNRELAGRTTALEAAQALAAERERLAEELASEAEALAEERDQALSRILELKALDEQQTRLLADAEEALGQRDRLLADADRELQDLAAALDARAAEAEELAALLEERTKERDALVGKVERLESDVRRLTGTREALAEIQRLVSSAASR